MEAILAKKPENYWPLLKRSIKLYRKSFSKIILFALALSMITFLPRLISDIIGQDIFGMVPLLSLQRLWLIVTSLIALIFFIGIIWHIHCVIRGVHEPYIEDFTVGIKKMVIALIAGIIQSIIIYGSFILLYTGLIFMSKHHLLFDKSTIGMLITSAIFVLLTMLMLYLWSLFIFFLPLIAIENKGVFTSLGRSVRLVWNHGIRAFTLQITPWIIYLYLLSFIRFFGIDIHIYFSMVQSHTIWSTLINLVVFALFIPWVAALMLVQLNDLELRNNLVPATKKRK